MKILSVHIQESFAPVMEDQETVIENLIDNQEEVVNEEQFVEEQKPSEYLRRFCIFNSKLVG